MTVSPLTNQVYTTTQQSSRNGAAIDHFIVHHAVSTSWQSVLSMMQGGKQVSANYIIANDGQIISVVPEEMRAWTSSSAYWDGRSVTVEVCNESLDANAGYPISAKAQDALTRLIGDVGKRYGFTPTFNGGYGTVLAHRDLVNIPPYQSYATACPGQYTYDRLPAIAATAASGADDNNDGSEAERLRKLRQNVALPLIAQQSDRKASNYGVNVVIWDTGIWHVIDGAQRDVWLATGAAFLDCTIPGRFDYLITEAKDRQDRLKKLLSS